MQVSRLILLYKHTFLKWAFNFSIIKLVNVCVVSVAF